MDYVYMRRALELAERGIGYTNPNPIVGAVIVKEGKVIGEGYHERYGSNHAEINAFLHAKEDVRDATMYVTLEPCSHYGNTPPCANAIAAKRIKKVVVAMQDPNPFVAGRGIQLLRDSGIEVVTGILEEESKKLNEIYVKYITTKEPFCILKTAMTLDGKIAAHTGDSMWITNEKSRDYVHKLRHRVSAIMVGIGTVLKDDPFLSTRMKEATGRDAVRIIVDSTARIPMKAKVLNGEASTRTIIAVTEKAAAQKLKELEGIGAEILMTPMHNDKVDLRYLMKSLGDRNIDSVLLEGGSEINYSAVNAGIVDKMLVFIAPKLIGGRNAKTPMGGIGRARMEDAIMLKRVELQRFEEDIMVEAYLNDCFKESKAHCLNNIRQFESFRS